MTLRRKKRLLEGLSLATLVVGGLAIYWGMSEPKATSHPNPMRTDPSLTSGTSNDTAENGSTEQLEQLAKRKLRQPIYDPPPPPPPVVKVTPPPKLNVKLLATVIDTSGSQAMLELNNQVVFRKVGEKLSDATGDAAVVKIDSQQVVIQRKEGEVTLSIGKEGS